ncbi:dhs-9 [Pristionchus pacificus]|uniref:Dhs-9 n=1 Tax=Pristionchus pacificus TaxID=54126 RepID=A0A2A6BDX0_PRIPA|nr:dhs-9 [Pristionchus pacificus]|eukprot:PDM64064.1 dhs-9 [Pristionchus pacificus]
MALRGQIAIVTGASRGIGQGIALQLGEAGATVYVTGRKPGQSDGNTKNGLPSLEQTAKEISDRGGKGIAVYVDHGNMEEVKSFFSRIDEENNGQLDILVNNAYAAVNAIFSETSKKAKFYDAEPEFWDLVNNVGLRNHYFCSVYASRLMVKNGKGLIVNISSPGGLTYLFNVAYGVGKQALDRMAADMAMELKSDGITSVSLWPGAVRTQIIQGALKDEKYAASGVGQMFLEGESIEYAGKAVVALAGDKRVIEKTGRILSTADLGDEYGFVDIDGRRPPNFRSISYALNRAGWTKTSQFIPGWFKCPGWVITAFCSKL